MRNILVTGGTVFVSRYVAEYFVAKGNNVFVLNRNHHDQPKGTILIEADRNQLGDCLKKYHFDVVLDITAYTGDDISHLLDAIGDFEKYVLLSSSAVYPETARNPFKENEILGSNKYWGKYGTDKIDAERILLSRVPNAIVLRPPYLYGPMNNLYREAFVFECAQKDRKFYLPKQGSMKLQFFHVHDLCTIIERLIDDNFMKMETDSKNNINSNQSQNHRCIYNVGNYDSVTVRDWVRLCYQVVGKEPVYVEVNDDIEQRQYFSFYHYEYELDVSAQKEIMPQLIDLKTGLEQSYCWYQEHRHEIQKKDFIAFIDKHLKLQ